MGKQNIEVQEMKLQVGVCQAPWHFQQPLPRWAGMLDHWYPTQVQGCYLLSSKKPVLWEGQSCWQTYQGRHQCWEMLSVDWEFTEQDQLYVSCCFMPGGRELQSELYKNCTSMPRGWLLEGAFLHSLPGSPSGKSRAGCRRSTNSALGQQCCGQ